MPHAARGSQNAQETSAQESGGKFLSRQAKWVKDGRFGAIATVSWAKFLIKITEQ